MGRLWRLAAEQREQGVMEAGGLKVSSRARAGWDAWGMAKAVLTPLRGLSLEAEEATKDAEPL